MDLKSSCLRPLSCAATAVLSIASAWMFVAPAHAACDFAPVKQQIDTVLDKDAAKGATFRREVADGADSIAMIEKLVAPAASEMVDICRFEVGEYLTKRGYPPFH